MSNPSGTPRILEASDEDHRLKTSDEGHRFIFQAGDDRREKGINILDIISEYGMIIRFIIRAKKTKDFWPAQDPRGSFKDLE